MRYMILLPGAMNLVLLAILWNNVERPLLGAVWCIAGIALHVVSDLGSPGWYGGLLMNLGAMVYLLFRIGVRN